MYICIYGYILKMNYLGVGLSPAQAQIFFDTNVHEIEEVFNVLMIEMNKGIWYIYCVD